MGIIMDLLGRLFDVLIKFIEPFIPALIVVVIFMGYDTMLRIADLQHVRDLNKETIELKKLVEQLEGKISSLEGLLENDKASGNIQLVTKIKSLQNEVDEVKNSTSEVYALLSTEPENIANITEIRLKLNSLEEDYKTLTSSTEAKFSKSYDNTVSFLMNILSNTTTIFSTFLGMIVGAWYTTYRQNRKNKPRVRVR